MNLKLYTFLAQCLILCVLYESILAKAMIGPEIRLLSPGSFNFIVSIKKINPRNIKPESDHECTGSLISRKDVLTVAHVFNNVLLSQLEIIVGSIDIRTGTSYLPKWWMNYDQWLRYKTSTPSHETNDIAIIRLDREVSEDIHPVAIHPIKPSEAIGLDFVIAGWGMTIERQISRFMKAAVTKAMSKVECESRIGHAMGQIGSIPDDVICSSAEPFAVTTAGNSGSPVLFLGSLVALHKAVCPSMGEVHPSAQVNIHLSLSNFEVFIREVMEIQ